MKVAICGLIIRYNDNVIKRNTLVRKNLDPDCKHDLILFHEGNISEAEQEQRMSEIPKLKFIDISDRCFKLPDWIDPEGGNGRMNGDKYERIGYKHMCRFYSLQIFDYLDDYDYVMRLDDDGFIETPVGFDLFEHMEEQGAEFLYRILDWDTHKPTLNRFPQIVHRYIEERGLTIPGSYDFIDVKLRTEQPPHTRHKWHTYPGLQTWSKGVMGFCTKLHSILGYYSNFYASRLDFWRRPDVQDFLNYIDKDGCIYYWRVGDQPIHAAALQLFLDPDKIIRTNSFTYNHYSHETVVPEGDEPEPGGMC